MPVSLVTGGAGFIGSHLVDRLLDRGDGVVVLDDFSTGSRANLARAGAHRRFEVVDASVLDEDTVRPLVERADRVFHLAAPVGVGMIVADPVRIVRDTVFGTEVVLRACADYRRPVVIASSSEVYGRSDALPLREDADLVFGSTARPRWSYGCAKAAAEFMAHAYARTTALAVVIARFFNVAGPRQTGRWGMVIPRLVDQALAGRPLTVYGDGRQSRCFCHVDDVVDAVVKLSETPRARGEVVNLGSDAPVTIRALAELVRTTTKTTAAIAHVPFAEAYDPDLEDLGARRPDLSKARALIGFSPGRDLRAIVADVVADRLRADRRPSAVAVDVAGAS
jgi:UDP-glucose 4-epimerase